ncbi:hypothetical protein G9A89_020175 [Geosiphon pyriformis]|nr:hypothetical protein G9A89_020175 [Geosiphon pyriformis]
MAIQKDKASGTTNHVLLVANNYSMKECGMTFLAKEEHATLHTNTQFLSATGEILEIKNNPSEPTDIVLCDFIYNPPPRMIYMIPKEKEPISSCVLESELPFNPNSNFNNNDDENTIIIINQPLIEPIGQPIQPQNQQNQQLLPVPPQQQQQLSPPQQQQMAYTPIAKFDKFNSEENESQILNQFIRGLCNSILQQVCLMYPVDLPTAVTYARDFEAAKLKANHAQAVNLAMNGSSELDSKLKQFKDATFSNQGIEQQQPPTNNISSATITKNESLDVIFSFELEKPSDMPLFSGAALEKKLITAMYTDAKVTKLIMLPAPELLLWMEPPKSQLAKLMTFQLKSMAL